MKHIHKYHRIQMGSDKVWACALGCGHYMPAHMTQLIPGKYSICWKCEEKFQLDHFNMLNDKPVCCDAGQNNIMDALERDGDKQLVNPVVNQSSQFKTLAEFQQFVKDVESGKFSDKS